MALDIAYTILVYENSKEEWKEEIMIKAQDKKDEEKKKAERRQNPKYHEGRGTDLKRYGNGWTEEGRKYYQELLKTFQDLKASVFWDVYLQGYWNEYQIKHYGRTRVDYDNTESDIDEEDGEPEEKGKVEADKSESDIDPGDVSDEDNEHRIRARRN